MIIYLINVCKSFVNISPLSRDMIDGMVNMYNLNNCFTCSVVSTNTWITHI